LIVFLGDIEENESGCVLLKHCDYMACVCNLWCRSCVYTFLGW